MNKTLLAALVAAPLLTVNVAASVTGAAHAHQAAAQQAAPQNNATWAKLDVPSGTYVLDPTHASIVWKVNHMGLSNYTARFTKFDATLNFDAAAPQNSTLTVTIDPRSVRTDYPFPKQEDFDAKIAGEAFLNSAQHPEIKFVSTKVERLTETTGKVYGNLTLNGVTKPISLDVTLNGAKTHPMRGGGALGFSAATSFNRSDFGVKNLVPVVGDEVTVLIEAEFLEKK